MCCKHFLFLQCNNSHNNYNLGKKSTIDKSLESSIKSHFASLIVRVAEKLNIKLENLRLFLISHLGCDGSILSGISSVRGIIETVTEKKLWDYYNYHALEGIIKHFAKDDTDLIEKMEDYKTRLTAFKATTKIADYIENCTENELMADNVDGISKMKYDKEFYRALSYKLRESNNSILKINEKCLSHIDDLWNDISAQFYLPPLPTLLEKIRGGSIEVTWLVATSIACIINAASQESIAFYQQKDIVRVMINDKVLYYDNEDTDPPVQVWLECIVRVHGVTVASDEGNKL